MEDRSKPILRRFAWVPATLLLWGVAAGHALADVVGRLKFSVKNAADEKPLANAKIVLKDSAGTRPDVTLTTDAQGTATSPQLEIRAWNVTTNAEKADTFDPDTRSVNVVADTTTDVEILLEPLKEKTIVVRSNKNALRQRDASNTSRIDQTFIQKFPTSPANNQDFSKLLRSRPGFAEDSVNQSHPRGEHSSTAIFINGFELPDVLQGRVGQILIPEVLQSLDVQTGGYAPEYGGETAAILNIDLRSGPITPIKNAYLQYGDYSTYNGSLTVGGQAGQAIGEPDANGRVARRFGYIINLNGYASDNLLQPPQPDYQTAHNHGESQSYFGNFDYTFDQRSRLSLTVNATPAYSEIANRAGLPASFATVGQGFGYAGGLSASDAAAAGIVSQQAAGQNIYQRDTNEFGVLNFRHEFSNKLSGLLSFGLVHSGQDILNSNPAVNLANLPADNSIEFNPTIRRNYHHTQGQGSLTYSASKHTVKAGLLLDDEEGDESYQLIPASQAALTALQGIDANGSLTPSNGVTPTLQVHRAGFYRAGYVQDTWAITRRATLNYGLRADWYKQNQNVPGQSGINQANLSPRINFAYAFNPRTVGRVSYNRLFIQPPLAQGAIIGQAIIPETLSQYDVSIERQVSPRQVAKIAAYYKDINNQIDTGLLIAGTQIGAYSSVNFTKGGVHGVELSYDLLPPANGTGLSAYANYTQSLAKPNGIINGDPTMPAPNYNDHDQLNTVNAGLNYTFRSGASIGGNIYHGSGVASSIIFADANGNGQRTPHTTVNLSLASGNRLFGGKGGITLSVENLFDDRSVINFNSGFSGTRFVQGRRVVFAINGSF